MFDLQVLPTTKLKELLGDNGKDLPSSLAQISLGEQIARAYAPEGGVECGTEQAPPGGGEQSKSPPKNLAYTSGAYNTVPMFWTGTGLLLLGVILVAAIPRRRTPAPVQFKPSPRPRS